MDFELLTFLGIMMISLVVLTIVLTKRVHADSDEMEKVLFEM